MNDLIYLSTDEKYTALIKDIKDTLKTGAPILVGTVSVETSEQLSKMLKEKMAHNVLM